MAAEIPIIQSKLNSNVMRAYERYPELLSALDQWILVPDYSLVPTLKELRSLVNKIQPHRDAKTTLYRGVSIGGQYKNDHNFKREGVDRKPGDTVMLTVTTPISFTTDRGIAAAFGSTLLSARPGQYLNQFLRVTDELSAIVCARRNVELVTQKEWVLLPDSSVSLSATVISYDRPRWYELWK